MIAVDTNILIYAHRPDFIQHERAREALRGLHEVGAPWAIPWPCLHEFTSVVTNPRVFVTPTPTSDALGAMRELLSLDGVRPLSESDDHLAGLEQMCCSGLVRGARFHDARIAAICLSRGVRTLWTADRDFTYFPDLATSNPVA